MSDEKKLKFNERFKVLHEKYCRQLPEKYQEVEDSWTEYQTDLSNPDYVETFYRLIHTLKGTAATFGFVRQADICFEVQKLLLTAKEEQSALSKSSVDQIKIHLSELKININTPAEDISE